jgi:hypothetical protein
MRLTLEQGNRWLVIANLQLGMEPQDAAEREWVRRLKRVYNLRKANGIIIVGDMWKKGIDNKLAEKSHRSLLNWLKNLTVFYLSGDTDRTSFKKIIIKGTSTAWPVLLQHRFGLRKPDIYSLTHSLRMTRKADTIRMKVIEGHPYNPEEQCDYFCCGSYPENGSYILINENNQVRLYTRPVRIILSSERYEKREKIHDTDTANSPTSARVRAKRVRSRRRAAKSSR